MPAILSRWEIRDPSKVRDWGLAALQYCRVQRGREGVVASRYWLSTATQISFLTEFELDTPATPGGDTADGAKAIADLFMLSENVSNEIWADARAASDTLTRAGV